MYEVFDHTADLGLRVRAADLGTLFAESARGLFSLIALNLDSIRPLEQMTFAMRGEALDLMLFDWLTELLYIYETRHLLLADFEVQVSGCELRAIGRGEPIDPTRHALDHEVKAITYHALKVEHTSDGWLAEIIVDI